MKNNITKGIIFGALLFLISAIIIPYIEGVTITNQILLQGFLIYFLLGSTLYIIVYTLLNKLKKK
ncbi:hypothetical protein THALO_200341 [Tenacibaculum halocynthiae]|uniref:hypothetical protein n=1 Tax=Tenacibaculum sp. E3R01 TaxID=2267227 RepID=UPI0008963B99|nr:hypothetical protein [Tenacibaculum sp. E3R01]SED97311.1 hypothetical protein SAMN04487765_0972 [Tenacibaculum sp. MAR_2010_89]